MSTSFLATKIVPPQIPQILPRPRLLERLKQDQDKRLTFILGQAAQGKTTLGVSYVQSSEIPSAWINLGPEDSDAVNFFYSLVCSLQRVLKDIDFSFILNYPALAFGPREEIYLYRDWAVAIFEAITVPTQIIFDGLDRLTADAPAFRFLQVLLDHAPPNFHLFFLSREMPGIEIQALKMKQEASVVTNEDLLFTLDESKKFVQDIRSLSLKHQVVKRLFDLTEGWIGGLVLLCEVLDRVPEQAREDFLSDRLTGKFRSEVCQFFDESVFSARPNHVQDFLIKSAILDIVDPDFIKAFTGLTEAQEILEALTRKNIFIQSSYHEKKGWQYRYHQLFREFLLRKFKARIDQENQRALYKQAGALSEQRGEWEEAIALYLRAEAHTEAARVLEKIGLDLLKLGRNADVSRLLEALPETIIQDNPWLLYFRFMIKRFSPSEGHGADIRRGFELFQQQGDVRGTLLTLAFLIEGCMYGHINLPLGSLLAQGEDLQQSLAMDQYPYERAALWLHMGFSYSLRESVLWKGLRTCQKAYLIAKDLGDMPLQLFALIYSYYFLGTMGEYAQAEELWRKVEKTIAAFPHPELRTMHLLYSAKLILQRGDIDDADIILQEAFAEMQNHGFLYLYPYGLHDLVMIKVFSGKDHEAEEVAKQIIDMTSATNPWMYGIGLLTVGWCYYHRGDFSKAREWFVRGEEEGYTVGVLSEFVQNLRKIFMGVTSCHLQRVNRDTEKQLQEALSHFTEMNNPYYSVQARLAMAILRISQGKTDEAIPYLQRGFAEAREKGFFHFYHITRTDLAKLSALALELEIEAADYAAHFLATRLAAYAGPELVRLSQHANPTVAGKAREVRQAIHRAGLPRLRLQTLGGFRLFRGDEEVENREWGGHQPTLLLKALLARGSTRVPQDLLIEDLWPEASPKEGERRFKVNLHRLRKTLEPRLDKTLGSSYLHLQANFLSLDNEICVDLEDFLTLCQEGERLESQGRVKQAQSCFQQAVDLYGGDFLAEERYHSWVERKRVELQSRYLEVLKRLARLHERRGHLRKAIKCYKQVIHTDPLAESAYQKLMLLYDQRGMRTAALRVYKHCQKVLREGLDAQPDQATTAIYRKILATGSHRSSI